MASARMPRLLSRGRQVQSPFGISRTDENALTAALGYTLHRCPLLLHRFLKLVGVGGIRRSSLEHVVIDIQRHQTGESGNGFTDIEIRLPGRFHIIVEAKVGMSVPGLQQCQKYAETLRKEDEPIQRLVTLVNSPDQHYVAQHTSRDPSLVGIVVPIFWPTFLTACIQIMNNDTSEAREWARHFYTFLDGEYRMKAFTTEVWLLSVNTKPLWPGGISLWDIHQNHRVYFDRTHPTVRPLYIAFRVRGKVDAIQRVTKIEHGLVMQEIVPDLVRFKSQNWPRLEHTVWYLDDPVPLVKPLRTGEGMFNRRVRCDLDLLLSCNTVQEIESAMGQRRMAK